MVGCSLGQHMLPYSAELQATQSWFIYSNMLAAKADVFKGLQVAVRNCKAVEDTSYIGKEAFLPAGRCALL